MNRRREIYYDAHTHMRREVGEPQKWAVLSTWRFFFLTSPPPPHHRGLLAQGGSSLCLVSPPPVGTQRSAYSGKRFQEFNFFSVLFSSFFRYANPTEKLIQWARSAREFYAKLIIPIVSISNYFAVNFTFFSTKKLPPLLGVVRKMLENLFDR